MGSRTPPTAAPVANSPVAGQNKTAALGAPRQDSQATLPVFPTRARLDSREVTATVSRTSGHGDAASHAHSNGVHINADGARPRGGGVGKAHPSPTSAPPPLPTSPADGKPKAEKPALNDRIHASISVHRDVRSYLPPLVSRFVGWRGTGAKAPFDPLPFPPFSWLRYIPIKYEVWVLSTIGAFVGIALIEIVMATAFANKDIILIVASFGASAVLVYGALDSPLAQPRNLVGGQVLCAIVGVALTRLFRHAHAYELSDTTVTGELGHVVWLNGALAMALALLAMLITDTVHPPAGATALIAAVQPSVVRLSWRYIYIVLISSLLMLGWALLINNIGRRRYPTYWISGKRVYVRPPPPEPATAAEEGRVSASLHRLRSRTRSVTQNEMMMAAMEGRNAGFDIMSRELARSTSRGSGSLGSRTSRTSEKAPLAPRQDVSASSTSSGWNEKDKESSSSKDAETHKNQ